jgi:hypothetical protein
VQFRHQGPSGLPFLASSVQRLFRPSPTSGVHASPADNDPDVLRDGLVNRLAWLIGLWLADDGTQQTSLSLEADKERAEVTESAVSDLNHTMLLRLPADAAFSDLQREDGSILLSSLSTEGWFATLLADLDIQMPCEENKSTVKRIPIGQSSSCLCSLVHMDVVGDNHLPSFSHWSCFVLS